MDPEELKSKVAYARKCLFKCGSHFVIDTINDLPDVIEQINQRLELGIAPWTLSTFKTGWNTTTYTDNYYSFSQCGQCRIQNHWWCSGAGAGEGEGEGGIMASFRLLEHLKIGQNIFFCHFNLIFLLFTCFYLWNTVLWINTKARGNMLYCWLIQY